MMEVKGNKKAQEETRHTLSEAFLPSPLGVSQFPLFWNYFSSALNQIRTQQILTLLSCRFPRFCLVDRRLRRGVEGGALVGWMKTPPEI